METAETKSCVLDQDTIKRKLRRMALQIAEENSNEESLVIAGIHGNGEVVAKCLVQELKEFSGMQLDVVSIQLNKKNPKEVYIQGTVNMNDRVVIIVDDVADTGRTMLYALKPFLDTHPRKIQTLVLVERSHKLFPIQNDYVGLSLTTTLQEHIAVETEGGEIKGAWLY
jgi:pyrimidine operon attenuation protein/uracil phosphoribosyltransferase